jgi:hypothetical protein
VPSGAVNAAITAWTEPDDKSVRRDPDTGAEIDRHEAGAVRIDRIAAGLPGSELFVQAQGAIAESW